MPSIMDCSGPNLKCWIPDCMFSSITQKGLTIHLMEIHNIRYRDKVRPVKGARSRRKLVPARELLPENWSRPYGCALCGYFCCSDKNELLRHVQQEHRGGPSQNFDDSQSHYLTRGNTNYPGGSLNQDYACREQGPYRSRGQMMSRYHPAQQETNPYDVFYGVNQPLAGSYMRQTGSISQEQEDQMRRSQVFNPQKTQTEWSQHRSLNQSPQSITRISSEGWNQQRIENGDYQMSQSSSGVDAVHSTQYDSTKDSMVASQVVSEDAQPCSQCGCVSRGGCTEKVVADSSSDVNRIILVEEGGLVENSTETDNHEVYHLQGGTSLGDLKAANFRQVYNRGDEIVLAYHTEDGREVMLRAIRAESGSEDTVETRPAGEDLALALTSPTCDDEVMKDALEATETPNFDSEQPLKAIESQPSEPAINPTDETMQSTLPELFPELFEDGLVDFELDSVTWPSGEAVESENFFEVCKKTEYVGALSRCRGVKVDNGLMLLKCGECSYNTDMSNSLEQLQVHIRKHMQTTFQCRHCEFTSSLREEMLVHAGTQHDVLNPQELLNDAGI